MKYYEKIGRYIQACWKTGGWNLMGLPLLPKRVFHFLPHNRTGYNDFLLWIDCLGLPKAAVIIDAGANHGDFSEAASAHFPAARVWLFEPLPALQPVLEERCGRHTPRWKLLPFALSNLEGTLDLHVAPGRDEIGSLKGFSKSYVGSVSSIGKVQITSCRVRRLDDVVREEGIDHVDLLKIDVEGAEFDLLAGAEATLAITETLVVEVSTIREGASDDSLMRLLRIMDEHGFRPLAILPSLYSSTHPWMPVEFNVLARRAP